MTHRRAASHQGQELVELGRDARGVLGHHGLAPTAANASAHHDDYGQPLSVMWLCPRHHAERHKEIGRPFGPKARRAA